MRKSNRTVVDEKMKKVILFSNYEGGNTIYENVNGKFVSENETISFSIMVKRIAHNDELRIRYGEDEFNCTVEY